MLNKLLKRCMPWMDKGRWYHIRVTAMLNLETLNVTNVTFDEPMFSQYEYDQNDNTVKIHFSDPGLNASIVDYKVIVNSHIEGQEVSYVSIPSDHAITLDRDQSGYSVGIHPMPGTIDIWLFIKTI